MSAPASPTLRSTVAVIDVLRFGSAMLVVLHHYLTMFALSPPRLIAQSPAGPIAPTWVEWSWFGWVGVEIFFVLSGYVIALSAMAGGGLPFLQRRLLRLAPAAWICATLTAFLILLADPYARDAIGARWLASVCFWPIAAQIDAPYWTLGIELCFYAMVAVQLGGRRPNPVAIEQFGWLLAIASLAYWVLSATWSPIANTSRTTDLLLLAHGGCFATGIALWAIHNYGRSRRRFVLLAAGLASAMIEIMHNAMFMADGLHIDSGPAVPLLLFAIAVGALAAAPTVQASLIRTLGAAQLARMGRLTYPLYLIHFELGAVCLTRLRDQGIPTTAALCLTLVGSIALAGAISSMAEPALRRGLARLVSRRDPEPDTHRTASLPAG